MIMIPAVVKGVVVMKVGSCVIALHAQIASRPVASDFAAPGGDVAFGPRTAAPPATCDPPATPLGPATTPRSGSYAARYSVAVGACDDGAAGRASASSSAVRTNGCASFASGTVCDRSCRSGLRITCPCSLPRSPSDLRARHRAVQSSCRWASVFVARCAASLPPT